MKGFFQRNKKLIIAGGIILLFTVLLCIPVTLKILVGVFGFAAYLYLAVCYVFFVLACKKISVPVTKKRLALYIITLVLLILTLHVGLCGKELTESGLGGYIGGSYDKFTVGGVLFSILSVPVVLLCKFVISIIVYFIATAVCGFFLIAPLVFEPTEKLSKKRSKGAPVAAEPAPVKKPAPAPAPATTFVRSAPVAATETELSLEDYPKDSKEYARKLLFGSAETKPFFREPAPQPAVDVYQPVAAPAPAPAPVASDEGHSSQVDIFGRPAAKDNAYRIIDGVDALLVRPDITPYTNEYLNSREEARSRLFGYDIAEDYAARKKRLEAETAREEKTAAEEVKDDIRTTRYIPPETIYETPQEEPEIELEEEPVEEISYGEALEPDDLEPEEETLPRIQDSPLVNAIRADRGDDAPINVFTTPAEQPPVVRQQPDVKPKPAPAPEPEPEEERDPFEIRSYRMKKPYAAPPVSLLEDHVREGYTPFVENYKELKEIFEVKLEQYNIQVKLQEVIKGPTVTLCILSLGDKCSINKVLSIEKDIERLLKLGEEDKINIRTKIPGSDYFGIEIPNKIKGTVAFKEVMASPEWTNATGALVLGLGKTNTGKIVVDDLADMPHALVAGSSGSGKSVCINAIIASLLYRYSPDELKLVLIDLKRVEMANFAGLPHMLFKNPLNKISEVMNALKWLDELTMKRYEIFCDMLCRNIKEYNAKVPDEKKMPRIVIIIDEASQLMTDPTARKTVEATLSSIARIARAAGVHMIFATQTPSKEVITSEIQNNMTTKIAFMVSDYVQSQVIFKSPEAAKLLGQGDMMIKKTAAPVRAQCAFVSTEEINAIVDYIKKNNPVEFDEDAIERILHGSKEEEIPVASVAEKPNNVLEVKNHDDDESFQELVREALRIFVTSGKVSATYIQRRFSKGYNTIANVMDYLEDKGYVSATVNNKRTLLISKEQFYELYPECRPVDDGE